MDSILDNVGLIDWIGRIVTTVVTVRVSRPLDRMDSLSRLKVPARFQNQVDLTGSAL